MVGKLRFSEGYVKCGLGKGGLSLPFYGGGETGHYRLKGKELKIVEPFQAFPDEPDELLEGPGNDTDGGEGDLLRRRVSGMDGARHGRSPF